MKKFLLLLTGLALLSAPIAGSAALPPPLSPAVGTVFDRIDTAISEAGNPGISGTSFLTDYLDWYWDGISEVYIAIDTARHVTQQQRSLPDSTACLRYDEWLFEQKLNEIRALIDAAAAEGDVFSIVGYESIYDDLDKEYTQFIRGALHPGITDEQWSVPLISEEGDMPDPSYPDTLCFFHSDYTPASEAGYGCGSVPLKKILSRLPTDAPSLRNSVAAELQAMTAAETIVKSRADAGREFERLMTGIDNFFEDDETSEPEPSAPTQRPVPQDGCIDRVNPGIIRTAARGPFSLTKNTASHTISFLEMRAKQDEERAIAASDVPTGDVMTDLPAYERWNLRQDFTAGQSAQIAATFAAAADPGLASEEIFAGLRTPIATLIKLGNTLSTPEAPLRGLRDFVRDFTNFLLHMCTDRPCNAKLEQVMRLNFTDECFAYGNGEYTEATEEDPQWKKCLCTATPGAPECAGTP